MDGDCSLKLSDKEIAASFGDSAWAVKFPPVLSIQQAAELLQVPLATLYAWRSRGLLKSCSRKMGKHVRFFRDRLIRLLFNEGLLGGR